MSDNDTTAGGAETASPATPNPRSPHPADRPRTYAAWLTATHNTGRRDAVGALARTWKQTEGNRPRRSGIDGLTRWFTDPANLDAISERSARPLSAGEVAEAAHAAAREYRAAQVAERGLVAGLPGTGLPNPQMRTPADDSTGEVLSVIYGQLSRIEGTMIEIAAQLREQAAQAAEHGALLAKVLSWQALQDQRIAPITALLEELRAAEQDDDGEMRDLEGRAESELPAAVAQWQGGLHFIHCRDDRCAGGSRCDCPCHLIDHPLEDQGSLADQLAAQQWSNGRDDDQPWSRPDADPVADIAAIGRLPSGVEGAQPVPDTSELPGSSPTPGLPETVYEVVRAEEGTFSATARVQPGVPLPAAIEAMPPGQQRDQATAAFRAVYPEQQPGPLTTEQAAMEAGQAAVSDPPLQSAGEIAPRSGLYGGHES